LDSNEREILEKTLKSCLSCQACLSACEHLEKLGHLSLYNVAEQVLRGQVDENVREFILKCDLCGLCSQSCPEQHNIPAIVMAARQLFLESGISYPELYRAMWVDHDWNTLTLYRDTYQIDYSDLIKTHCETLFFAGCLLANEAPGLVRATVKWLNEHIDQETGLTVMCCGLPLAQIGLAKRAERYARRLWEMFRDTGARRIVTACPGCHYHLLNCQSLPGVEVVSLYKLMADSGVRAANTGIGKITVHDSCPDREGEIGGRVRELLGNYEIVEMAHHSRESICCGSGGIVSMVDPELCSNRATRRLMEFNEVGADICITYCMACASRLSRVFGPGKVRHILELIFNQSVDYKRNADRAKAMWEGEWGEHNRYRLENSHPLET
jgi:fumarate reductase (CoM/CoB) subunit B